MFTCVLLDQDIGYSKYIFFVKVNLIRMIYFGLKCLGNAMDADRDFHSVTSYLGYFLTSLFSSR